MLVCSDIVSVVQCLAFCRFVWSYHVDPRTDFVGTHDNAHLKFNDPLRCNIITLSPGLSLNTRASITGQFGSNKHHSKNPNNASFQYMELIFAIVAMLCSSDVSLL